MSVHTTDSRECEWGGWVRGATVTPPGHWGVIIHPVIAANDTVVVVAGARKLYASGDKTLTLKTLLEPVLEPVILRQQLNGTVEELPIPTELGTIGDPRPAIDASGTLHLVWGEPDTILTRKRYSEQTEPEYYRSIWTSTYRGARWSPPQRIYASSGTLAVNWEPPSTAGFVGDATSLEIAVPVTVPDSDHERQRQVAWITLRDGAWRVRLIPLGGTITQVALAEPKPGNVIVAYIGMPPAQEDQALHVRFDWAAVFVTRSLDGGTTWLPRVRLDRPADFRGGDFVAWPRLALAHDSLYLLWLFSAGDSSALRAAVVPEAGASWLRLPDLPVGSNSGLLGAAADSCGVVHVALQTGEPSVVYATLSGTRWNLGPSVIASGAPGDQPALAVTRSRIYMVWSSADTILGHFPPTVPNLYGLRAREIVRMLR